MALFNRNKDKSALPEIDKYYDGERRDRSGLAWLLAMVSVIIVTLLIIGLFLLGRWAYRSFISDNNSGDTTSEQQDGNEDAPSFDGGGSSDDGSDSEANDGETDEPDDSEGSADDSSDGSSSTDGEEGSVDAPVRTDTPSDSTAQVPATGDDPLPNTGPAGIATVFMGVSTLAGGVHYIVERKRSKQ